MSQKKPTATRALQDQQPSTSERRTKKPKVSAHHLSQYGSKIDPLDKNFEAEDVNSGLPMEWIGSKDRLSQEVEILMLDWAIRFPLLKPRDFLVVEKGYTMTQAMFMLKESGGETEWTIKRAEIQDKLTETLVKRHVDQIAEVQDTHVKASKIALAKAIEMLSKLQIEPYKDEDGKIVIDPKTKRPIYRGFRSIDLMNCVSSIKVSQEIYHRAMGLPTNGEGMAQVLDQVTRANQQNNQSVNINLTVNPKKQEAERKIEDFMEQLEYEDIREFVDYRRQQKKRDIDAEATTFTDRDSGDV